MGRFQLLLFFSVTLASAAEIPPAELIEREFQEFRALSGNPWRIVTGEWNGAPIPPEFADSYRVHADENVWVVRNLNDGTASRGLFELDFSQSPVRLQWTVENDSSPWSGKKVSGIYERQANGLRVYLARPGEESPKSFPTAADGRALFSGTLEQIDPLQWSKDILRTVERDLRTATGADRYRLHRNGVQYAILAGDQEAAERYAKELAEWVAQDPIPPTTREALDNQMILGQVAARKRDFEEAGRRLLNMADYPGFHGQQYDLARDLLEYFQVEPVRKFVERLAQNDAIDPEQRDQWVQWLNEGFDPVFESRVAPRDPRTAFELEALGGEWQFASGQSGSAFRNYLGLTVEVKSGTTMARFLARLFDGSESRGRIRIDARANPKRIDIAISEGPWQGIVLEGIYRIEMDELKVSIASPGRERPTEFVTPRQSDRFLICFDRTLRPGGRAVSFKQEARLAVKKVEKATMFNIFEMAKAAKWSMLAGDVAQAEKYARLLLEPTAVAPGGNREKSVDGAIHLVLGQIVLGRGQIEEAKRHLRGMADCYDPDNDFVGGPIVNPDMTLAKALLERQEKDAVLDYLAAVRAIENDTFIQKRLDHWSKLIRAGAMPDFRFHIPQGEDLDGD